VRGLAAAQAGRLVTFSVKPRHANTCYGYIQRGEPIRGIEGVFAVDHFVEKPDHATAQHFADSGTFFWNS
jgi:mannose-1-phosphate guanylyltransferase/mannose-6-phosphate isomerase